MKWQEYQEAVGELYARLETFGFVKKNVFIPDRITGQKRQVDVWLEAIIGGHAVNFLIDAKLRSFPIDVKDVEEILELANSVKANKAILVTNQGWTAPAKIKADFYAMDLKLLTIEEALNLLVPEKWFMCYNCDDCVVLDKDGVLFRRRENLFFFWLAGSCRECGSLYLYCDECGAKVIVEDSDPWKCNCGHAWKYQEQKLYLKIHKKKKFIRVDNAAKPTDEFMFWLKGYPPKYWENVIVDKIMCVGDDDGGLYRFLIPPVK